MILARVQACYYAILWPDKHAWCVGVQLMMWCS